MKKKIITTNNRNFIYNPNDIRMNKMGYVYYSRYLMENKIKRLLKKNEMVHHINNNSLDDDIDNLRIVDAKEHAIIHHKGKKRNKEIENIIKELDSFKKNYNFTYLQIASMLDITPRNLRRWIREGVEPLPVFQKKIKQLLNK